MELKVSSSAAVADGFHGGKPQPTSNRNPGGEMRPLRSLQRVSNQLLRVRKGLEIAIRFTKETFK
jgi:hypothetical protein